MKKSTPLIVGNWKLNPVNQNDAVKLATEVVKKTKKCDHADIAFAPPAVYVDCAGKKIAKSKVALAAQNVHSEVMGAFTGETSAMQLRGLGCDYVIIGHSERRAMGETDEEVQEKVLVSMKYKLTPIVCIGESDRDEKGDFFSFVESQLRSLGKALTAAQIKKIVIAYEPIWAIGTGKTASAEDVKEMQLFIESVLTKIYDRPVAKKVKLLYGGSVKPLNAKELHDEGGMNGFLVGGASLKAQDFADIINATI